jgi:uncharacterized membrane protein
MKRFSPSDAALEGFRLTRERPGTVLAWSGIYFVGILIIAIVMMASLSQDLIGALKKGQLPTRDPQEMGAMLAQSWPAFVLVLALTVLLLSIMMGGIYRLVLRPQETGVAHLRFGRDELRLTAINLLLFAIGILCLAFGLLVTRLAEGSSPLIGLVVGCSAVAVTVWLGVRLSLATPMTFATHQMSIRQAWGLTRGYFWPLFGMLLLAVIFYVIIWTLITIIGYVIITLAGGQQSLEDLSSPVAVIAFVATLVIQLLLPILQVVMIYSPLAIAYQQLHGDPPTRMKGAAREDG